MTVVSNFVDREITMADLKDTRCLGKRNDKVQGANGATNQCLCCFTRSEIRDHRHYNADDDLCPKCQHDISWHPAGLPQQGNVPSVPSYCIRFQHICLSSKSFISCASKRILFSIPLRLWSIRSCIDLQFDLCVYTVDRRCSVVCSR